MGRPRLTLEDRMAQEGHYHMARYELIGHMGRLPTVAEVAEYMEVSPRTVETIRAGMQEWRREAATALGWADWSDEPVHPFDGTASPLALIRAAYALGEITTAEASRELALLGLPSDARELRRWRKGLQQPE